MCYPILKIELHATKYEQIFRGSEYRQTHNSEETYNSVIHVNTFIY
jgi:hypothetical protein